MFWLCSPLRAMVPFVTISHSALALALSPISCKLFLTSSSLLILDPSDFPPIVWPPSLIHSVHMAQPLRPFLFISFIRSGVYFYKHVQ